MAKIGLRAWASGLMTLGWLIVGLELKAQADETTVRPPQTETSDAPEKKPRVIYPKKTELDLDAMQIQGELKNPGDFYFQVKPEDKMDSLVKRRKNFHRQMLRDVMFSK